MDNKILITNEGVVKEKSVHSLPHPNINVLKKYAEKAKIHSTLTPGRLYGQSEERTSSFYIPASMEYYSNRSEYKTKETYDRSTGRMGLNDFKKHFIKMFHQDFSALEEFSEKNIEVARKHLVWTAKLFHIDPRPLMDSNISWMTLPIIWDTILWSRISRMLENPGLALQVQELESYKSRAYWSVLLTSGHSPALEASYRYGYNFVGIFGPFKESDPVLFWVPNTMPGDLADPSFKFQYDRDKTCCNLLVDLLNKKEVSNVLILGAGMLPLLRYHNYLEERVKTDHIQKIYACDSDTTIDKDCFLEDPILKECVEYEYASIQDTLGLLTKAARKFDLILMTGVMSFCLPHADQLIPAIINLLEDDGEFVFDLQYDNWNMRRNLYCYNWGGIDSPEKITLLSDAEMKSVIKGMVRKLSTIPSLLRRNFSSEKNVTINDVTESGCTMGAFVTIHFT